MVFITIPFRWSFRWLQQTVNLLKQKPTWQTWDPGEKLFVFKTGVSVLPWFRPNKSCMLGFTVSSHVRNMFVRTQFSNRIPTGSRMLLRMKRQKAVGWTACQRAQEFVTATAKFGSISRDTFVVFDPKASYLRQWISRNCKVAAISWGQ